MYVFIVRILSQYPCDLCRQSTTSRIKLLYGFEYERLETIACLAEITLQLAISARGPKPQTEDVCYRHQRS